MDTIKQREIYGTGLISVVTLFFQGNFLEIPSASSYGAGNSSLCLDDFGVKEQCAV